MKVIENNKFNPPFLVAIVVFIVIFVWNGIRPTYTCLYEDDRLCKALSVFYKSAFNQQKGEYFETISGKIINKLDWILDGKNEELKLYKDKKVDLHLIVKSEKLYLKLGENKWLMQPFDEKITRVIMLPFEPSVFMRNFLESLHPNISTISFVKEVKCGNEKCFEYKIESKQQPESLRLFVNKSNYIIHSIIFSENDIVKQITFQKNGQKIVVPNEEVQLADADQNIFLEQYFNNLNTEIKKDAPSYVLEFEKERLKIENQSTN